MYRNDKRHSHGQLMPNIYSILQVIVLTLVLSLIVQLTGIFELDIFVLLLSALISIGVVFYILIRRKRVIQRQHDD